MIVIIVIFIIVIIIKPRGSRTVSEFLVVQLKSDNDVLNLVPISRIGWNANTHRCVETNLAFQHGLENH